MATDLIKSGCFNNLDPAVTTSRTKGVSVVSWLCRPHQPVGMESELLIGWQQEKAELKREVCRLQEEMAESRAEREELESRSRALNDRVRRGSRGEGSQVIIKVNQTNTPPSLSLFPAAPVSVSFTGTLSASGG